MPISMRGQRGELRNGYQVAAQLRAWSLDSGQVLTSGIVDEFWAAGDLSLWLIVGRRAWVWRQAELAGREGDQLRIRVTGSPEVRDDPAA
jgi:hypothetical protein